MQVLSIDHLNIYFNNEDRDTAELVQQACRRSLQLIHQIWDLPLPKDCRFYVLNAAWLKSIFHAAPWPWRIGMGITLPLWYFRTKKLWRVSAGWALAFGKRCFIGVKPPRLIQLSDRSMGSRIFIQNDNLESKLQEVVCHELTHACASHLKLTPWLNEGLAMFTVDQYARKPTVREDTLDILRGATEKPGITSYRKINVKNQAKLISVCVRGYWITRYLEEIQPGTLKQLLAQRISHLEMENRLASACGLSRDMFWSRVGEMVLTYFRME
jgi:hypothetical protein